MPGYESIQVTVRDIPAEALGVTALGSGMHDSEGAAQAKPASDRDELRYDALGVLKSLGACRGVDPNIFYPDPSDEAGEYTAKEVCASCRVRRACLNFALETREAHGIWGGASERDRRIILRQRAKSARQPSA